VSDHITAEGTQPHSGASNFNDQGVRPQPGASNLNAVTRSPTDALKPDSEGTRAQSGTSKFNSQSAPSLQAGAIRPSYLREQGEFWSAEIHRVLEGRIERKSLNRILNAIKLGQNGLFNRLLDTVYQPDRSTYLCFSDHVYLNFKNKAQSKMHWYTAGKNSRPDFHSSRIRSHSAS